MNKFRLILAVLFAVAFAPIVEAQCSGFGCRIRARRAARVEMRQASSYGGGYGSAGGAAGYGAYSAGSHGGYGGYSAPAPVDGAYSRELPAWNQSSAKPVKVRAVSKPAATKARKCSNPDCQCVNCDCGPDCPCGTKKQSALLTKLPEWNDEKLVVLPAFEVPALASL